MHPVKAVPIRYNPFVNGEKTPKTHSSIKPVKTQKSRCVGLFFKNPGFLNPVRAYVTPKSFKGFLKKRFFRFLNKSQHQLNKFCYKVSLCKNFQQHSCSTAIPLSNGP